MSRGRWIQRATYKDVVEGQAEVHGEGQSRCPEVDVSKISTDTAVFDMEAQDIQELSDGEVKRRLNGSHMEEPIFPGNAPPRRASGATVFGDIAAVTERTGQASSGMIGPVAGVLLDISHEIFKEIVQKVDALDWVSEYLHVDRAEKVECVSEVAVDNCQTGRSSAPSLNRDMLNVDHGNAE
jgi:hypothetical protein